MVPFRPGSPYPPTAVHHHRSPGRFLGLYPTRGHVCAKPFWLRCAPRRAVSHKGPFWRDQVSKSRPSSADATRPKHLRRHVAGLRPPNHLGATTDIVGVSSCGWPVALDAPGSPLAIWSPAPELPNRPRHHPRAPTHHVSATIPSRPHASRVRSNLSLIAVATQRLISPPRSISKHRYGTWRCFVPRPETPISPFAVPAPLHRINKTFIQQVRFEKLRKLRGFCSADAQAMPKFRFWANRQEIKRS